MTPATALACARQDAPAVIGFALSARPDEAKRARSFTRDTLASWNLADLADDATVIVGELLANAIRHAGIGSPALRAAEPGIEATGLGLWLLRDNEGFMCVVTDPSDHAPALKQPGDCDEGGRGLHVIHSLSDHWGWSPLSGHGKAVWAILFRH
jgi:anti-sigma regulatory factor (Ser/Thr protein kinase)